MAASSSHSTSISSSLSIPDFTIHENKLYLLGREGKDSSAYAISMKKTSIFSNYVLINGTVNGRTESFHINVSSVAKKLGLKKSKVKEIAKKESGIFLLRRAAAIHQFMKNSKIEEKYKKKLKTKYKDSEIKTFKIGDDRYFINYKNFYLYKSQNLLNGNYGKVYKISNLVEPESPVLALKKAKRKDVKSTSDLQNEFEILKKINSLGNIPGIQYPPNLLAEGSYITHLYDGDLVNMVGMSEFINLNSKDKLKLMGQLIVGLCHVHNLGYFHGDIKPENCLVEKDKTGKGGIASVVLSDFGGARETATWDNSRNFTNTRQYLPPEIFTRRSFPGNVIQSSDVYALLKTIFVILINESPEQLTWEHDEKLKAIIPERLANVFLEGMHYPIARQLTAAQLLNNFSIAFIKEYGEDFRQNTTAEGGSLSN